MVYSMIYETEWFRSLKFDNWEKNIVTKISNITFATLKQKKVKKKGGFPKAYKNMCYEQSGKNIFPRVYEVKKNYQGISGVVFENSKGFGFFKGLYKAADSFDCE